MGMNASYQSHNHHAWEDEIRKVLSIPNDKMMVFFAFQGLADPGIQCCGHNAPLRTMESGKWRIEKLFLFYFPLSTLHSPLSTLHCGNHSFRSSGVMAS